jgi:hypothetical protein
MGPTLDEDELIDRFKDLLSGLIGERTFLTDSGRDPREFIINLTPIAQRHGVLEQLQRSEHWQGCNNGRWNTVGVSTLAVVLGVTVLEIEAVYRLTYGGKS